MGSGKLGKRQPSYRYSRPSFDLRMQQLLAESIKEEQAKAEREAELDRAKQVSAYDLVPEVEWTDIRRAAASSPVFVTNMAKSAAIGTGIPLVLWFVLWVLACVYLAIELGVPAAISEMLSSSRWITHVVIGLAMCWIAPLNEIGYTFNRLGALRSNLGHLVPLARRIPDMPPLLPAFLLHLPIVIENLESMAPLVPMLDKHWEAMRPEMPKMLARFDELMPLLKHIEPKKEEFEPYLLKVIPHWELLIPHLTTCLPYIDQLMPLLDIRGWEEALPFLDELAPHVPLLAPHAERLAPYMDPSLPYLPILVKHIDNLAPQMENTIEVLDRLIPLIGFLPVCDQVGIMNSRLALMALPTMARLLPRQRSTDTLRALASPVKGIENISLQVPKASRMSLRDGTSCVFYTVMLDKKRVRKMRYSELHVLQQAIHKESSTYCRMKMTPFPGKTAFGRNLSDNGIERRRVSLEIYLENCASFATALSEESAAFREFVRSFQ